MAAYVLPELGRMSVEAVASADVKRVLRMARTCRAATWPTASPRILDNWPCDGQPVSTLSV